MSALHGFEQTRQRRIGELDAVLHEYTHAASGARLCWLEREDENKSFCAAFRTLPFDDSGVFHILEHSVLCGSKHFPVKEPFVELMKGSLNTFLNALTFPDKTCYPVASRNGRDFLNLMRVYLDAVFFPSIHEKPEIFRQEGWHYELRDGVLTRSGVVLNEMKGAFADADELLISAMSRALFPDSPYRFVSGGDPESIPELTYEAFAAAHKRFYHPSNSYLLLDGSIDQDESFALLDEYLSQFTAIDPDTQIAVQQPVCAPRTTVFYPLPAGEDALRRWKLGRGHVIGTYRDVQTLFAAQVLSDVLCGSNHAPLCRAILEKGLAEDVTLGCDDQCMQPVLLLQVQNFREAELPAIQTTLRDTLTSLCENGLDREQIEASLASFEFKLRERDYGTMPRGLIFELEILSSWLYDGDPAARLHFGEVFEALHAAVGTGYYEELLRRLLLENTHTAEILLRPSQTCGQERQARERETLQKTLETLDEAQRSRIVSEQERLAALQQEPDSPEALAAIPHVQLSDLPRDPAPIPTETEEDGRLILHAVQTDGIVYPTIYFEADDLPEAQLPYMSVLRAALGQLPAGSMDAQELQKQLRLKLGSLSATLAPYSQYHAPQRYRLYAAVSFSALESKLPEAVRLAAQILTGTDFSDKGKLLELIRQQRDSLQQQIVNSGSSAAMLRASAALNAASACSERCSGVSYYRWLRELEQNFDVRADALIETLRMLCETLFVTARMRLSVTGGSRQSAGLVQAGLHEALPAGTAPGAPQQAQLLPALREGIVIPSEVSFTAVCGDVRAYSGDLRIACRAASLGHYWNEIRVQGGAYGTGLLVRETGLVCAYTYRDPDCRRSRGAIGRTAAYLEAAAASGEAQDVNIIGAISDAEPLLSPRLQGAVADTWLLKGLTMDDRRRMRHELLDAGPASLAACAGTIGGALDTGVVCVLGPRTQLEACGDLELHEL